ncbi:hypothetical protein NKH99_25095 [Mesorhizobium sp. M0854]|uniref:hypothetical protein n=1 Tax=Mesorhizobium sp. M0854 TaxID=2957013 RepID=UPI00333BABB2
MSSHQLQIRGVSKIDSLKLQNELGEGNSTFEADSLSGGRHGDLGLGVVTVVLTLAALKVVGRYLLRKHKSTEWTDTTVEIKDGKRIERTVIYKRKESEAPEKTVVEAIVEALGIDLSTLAS